MTREYSGGKDPTQSMALLWQGRERPSRGPKPGLSVEAIVQAAIRVADSEGLAALSMRRVADELGVGTMSLYRYVPNKSVLLDVMMDTVIGEALGADEPSGGWRVKLEASAREELALLLRHPWMLQVAVGRPVLGPNELAAVERQLGVVAGLGLTEHEMMGVIGLVDSHVRGVAQLFVDAAQAAQRTGVSDEQFWTAVSSGLEAAVREDRFPLLWKVSTAGVFDPAADEMFLFEFGLQRVLDGVETLVEARAAGVR
jgi:AcrR family transcriptional regulator